MKITIEVQLPSNNPILFYEACQAIVATLAELACQAEEADDARQFLGTHHPLSTKSAPDVEIGSVVISDSSVNDYLP